jgi:RNA polymerase sigma-70 factor (ECF subfamily)
LPIKYTIPPLLINLGPYFNPIDLSLNHLHNEQLLLQRVTDGDEQAFTSLFNAYKDKLYSFVYDITGSETKAEDTVQEVFLKIWQQREGLNKVHQFNAYIFRMCRNYAIDQLRKLSREILLHSSLLQPEHTADRSADDALLQKEAREKLQEAIDQLPTQQKRVFILHRENGLRQQEIAHELNLSLSTVQNHLFRAVGNIRQYLNTTYPDISFYLLLAMGPILFV